MCVRARARVCVCVCVFVYMWVCACLRTCDVAKRTPRAVRRFRDESCEALQTHSVSKQNMCRQIEDAEHEINMASIGLPNEHFGDPGSDFWTPNWVEEGLSDSSRGGLET